MAKRRTRKKPIEVTTITHDEASRRNIPTAEYRSVMEKGDQSPVQVAYQRRNRDLDPQLVWRGKDEQDWSDLVVQAPPLFIQEKVHPKVLIDDLVRRSKQGEQAADDQLDLFADFNGLPDDNARTEFYRHDANWSNRMILGDSLQVMASLAEREGLRGKVQCIYLDPPYGIKFNSNFQWSTTSRDVRDGKAEHITREPEQVKAFRDTWRDGIHSYLTYLRDRLTVARDLLTESGSIFVQIGDENVHYVRALMDEVMGKDNAISQIAFRTTTGRAGSTLAGAVNYLLWYARDTAHVKYRSLFANKREASSTGVVYTRIRHKGSGFSRRLTSDESSDYGRIPDDFSLFRPDNLTSTRPAGAGDVREFRFRGQTYSPGKGTFKTNETGLNRLAQADRIWPTIVNTVQYVRFFDDFAAIPIANVWMDTGTGSFTEDKLYVVQTNVKVVERCIQMTTDPGDLVLDPTCGSGTAAYIAEQWGRRWITIDTSRVALALARSRVMGARYPYYLLADSTAGREKEAELTQKVATEAPIGGDIRQGFVYERVPHITLKSIANNAEVDVLSDRWQETLEPLRAGLNGALGCAWEEWEIPREPGEAWSEPATAAWKRLQSARSDAQRADALLALNNALRRDYTLDDVPDQPRDPWDAGPTDLHRRWWEARIARQKEIDASIAAKADFEYLYDKPYEDRGIVRVAGPFTVESLAPHRTLAVDENDQLIDHLAETKAGYDGQHDFATMILEHLNTSGVQQVHREDRISFTALTPWPGDLICAEGRYLRGRRRTPVPSVVQASSSAPSSARCPARISCAATREAADADFDVLDRLCFQLSRHTPPNSTNWAAFPMLKARMNADLHMAEDLKKTDTANLFVIFGEPDIDIEPASGDDGTEEDSDPDQDQRRRRLRPLRRRSPQRRPRRHRLLVRRHRLQRRELLRPPSLLPRRRRPLQVPQDHPKGRDRPRRLGDAATATPPAPSTAPPPAASPSRSSTTSATK